ncbi:MAG: SPASM domain-containing protein [Bacteroidetes bacterium]|nr:SPASM domain-containing protein [Bacteroidota bacterium]
MIRYYFQILLKLSFFKIYNLIKLYLSFHYSKLLKKPFHFALPASISIEPTTSCNLRCPQCPSGLRTFTRPIGMLEQIFFTKTIHELQRHLVSLTFYFQGEPYLNANFLKMVKIASQAKIYTVTSTNAHFLTAQNCIDTINSQLDKIIISIDGTTQETYSKYRIGGTLDKLLEGTKELVKHKKALKSKTPFIVWQFVVFKHNQHQIDDVIKMGKEYGVDKVQIKTAQIYDFENGNSLIPDIDKYSRYKKNISGKFEIKNKLLNQCWRMWQSCVITWDGNIVPCCFDKDAKYTLGNLNINSFKTIWFSDVYKKFRAQILKGRNQLDICKNCTEGTKVWAD